MPLSEYEYTGRLPEPREPLWVVFPSHIEEYVRWDVEFYPDLGERIIVFFMQGGRWFQSTHHILNQDVFLSEAEALGAWKKSLRRQRRKQFAQLLYAEQRMRALEVPAHA